jgi:hypothetical protein
MEKTESFHEQATIRKSRSSELPTRNICESEENTIQLIERKKSKRDVSDVSVNLYINIQPEIQTDGFYFLLKRHHLLDLGNGLTGVETLGACP